MRLFIVLIVLVFHLGLATRVQSNFERIKAKTTIDYLFRTSIDSLRESFPRLKQFFSLCEQRIRTLKTQRNQQIRTTSSSSQSLQFGAFLNPKISASLLLSAGNERSKRPRAPATTLTVRNRLGQFPPTPEPIKLKPSKNNTLFNADAMNFNTIKLQKQETLNNALIEFERYNQFNAQISQEKTPFWMLYNYPNRIYWIYLYNEHQKLSKDLGVITGMYYVLLLDEFIKDTNELLEVANMTLAGTNKADEKELKHAIQKSVKLLKKMHDKSKAFKYEMTEIAEHKKYTLSVPIFEVKGVGNFPPSTKPINLPSLNNAAFDEANMNKQTTLLKEQNTKNVELMKFSKYTKDRSKLSYSKVPFYISYVYPNILFSNYLTRNWHNITKKNHDAITGMLYVYLLDLFIKDTNELLKVANTTLAGTKEEAEEKLQIEIQKSFKLLKEMYERSLDLKIEMLDIAEKNGYKIVPCKNLLIY